MTQVQIVEIESDRDWTPDNGNPMRIIEATILLPDGRHEHRRWIRQVGSDPVSPGDKFEVELFEKNGAGRMRLAPRNGGSPPPLLRDTGGVATQTQDDRTHAIQWQHSQEMAIRYLAVTGGKDDLANLRKLTQHFYDEISGKAPPSSPEKDTGPGGIPTTPGADSPPATVSADDDSIPF